MIQNNIFFKEEALKTFNLRYIKENGKVFVKILILFIHTLTVSIHIEKWHITRKLAAQKLHTSIEKNIHIISQNQTYRLKMKWHKHVHH